MSAPGLLTLLIPAVGGQGGGVLAEWIVDAATTDGYAVQSTSIPGVAQRTGSTTYYVELYTGPEADPPNFSLYPVPGALDVLLAPEFLEVGRSIEAGFPSPERTTIIASTHRLYSIHEKIATGRAIYPVEPLQGAARQFSRALIAFDALALAREERTEVNAILLGALAASGAMPVRPEAYRDAITRMGVQVEANLRGFDVGLRQVQTPTAVPVPPVKRPLRGLPEFAGALDVFPAGMRPLLGEAVARLVDYQDAAYARLYLARLQPFVGSGRDPEVGPIVATHLAVWMTYEDAIRVADLKTRASRFARIRDEAQARGAEIEVTDYLKPDLDEIYGILPYRLVAPFARWAERRWPHGRPTLGQRVKTTTISGFLRVWLLARCRWWRRMSYRARREHERIEQWLQAVRRCMEWDRELACEVARAAQLVKGYGDVRRRMGAAFEDLLTTALAAAALEAASGRGFGVSTQLSRVYRALVLAGPEEEPAARALAAEVLRHLKGGDPEPARAALARAER